MFCCLAVTLCGTGASSDGQCGVCVEGGVFCCLAVTLCGTGASSDGQCGVCVCVGGECFAAWQ